MNVRKKVESVLELNKGKSRFYLEWEACKKIRDDFDEIAYGTLMPLSFIISSVGFGMLLVGIKWIAFVGIIMMAIGILTPCVAASIKAYYIENGCEILEEIYKKKEEDAA